MTREPDTRLVRVQAQDQDCTATLAQNLGLTIFVHACWTWSGPRCISRLLVQSWSWSWSGDGWSDYSCSRMVGMLRTKMLVMTPCALLVLVLVRALYAYCTRTWSNSSCGMRTVCVLGLTHHVECKSCGS